MIGSRVQFENSRSFLESIVDVNELPVQMNIDPGQRISCEKPVNAPQFLPVLLHATHSREILVMYTAYPRRQTTHTNGRKILCVEALLMSDSRNTV